MSSKISANLERIVTPGDFSTTAAASVSYLAIVLIFAFDIGTDATIQLHLLYVFPLTMIALHCKQVNLVVWAVILALCLQGITLVSYGDIPLFSKLVLALLVLPTNILVAYVSRIARTNYLETRRIATIDPLTELDNRRSIESYTNMEIERQRRYGGVFSVAVLDLDGFKALNDSRGHHTGDEALKVVADVLRKQTRHSDMVGRLGGDEFVILLPNTEAEDCLSLCQQLALKIANRMSEDSFAITASIGCTTIDQPPPSALDVLIKADKAMYAAKAKGKGSVVHL